MSNWINYLQYGIFFILQRKKYNCRDPPKYKREINNFLGGKNGEKYIITK